MVLLKKAASLSIPPRTAKQSKQNHILAKWTARGGWAPVAVVLLLLLLSWYTTVSRLDRVHRRLERRAVFGHQPAHHLSSVSILASPSGSGLVNKYYYEFRNVFAQDTGRILVFYDPDTFGFNVTDYWVDILSVNDSSPRLPTTIVIKGEVHTSPWHYLNVEYIPATPSARPSPCMDDGSEARWIQNPAILLQARYSYNIWHSLNEGIMSVFQTLRELGHLPLVRIGNGGEMKTVNDSELVQRYEYNPFTGRVIDVPGNVPGNGSAQANVQKCNPSSSSVQQQSWCHPGALVSLHGRDVQKGYAAAKLAPVILAYTHSSLENSWAHLYGAMTRHVYDWEAVVGKRGVCLTSLIIGHTSTLNFYQSISQVAPNKYAMRKYPHVEARLARERAMAVFQDFVRTAQEIHVANQTYSGYSDRRREMLRRGIGPEGYKPCLRDAVYAREVPGMVRLELDDLKTKAEKAVRDLEYLGKLQRQHIANRNLTYEERGLRDGEPDSNNLVLRDPKPSTPAYDDYEAIAAGELESTLNRDEEPYHDASDCDFGVDVGVDKQHKQEREESRPVVTYMSRNFFSRGILNEGDIVEYILTRYNVTLRVTTLEEPLLDVMDSLASSDVVIGMHGAGWTNGLFIKRGAVALQMFPYGWQSSNDSSTFRGYNYKEIVLASQCLYYEWVNPAADNAFFRRFDYTKANGQTKTFSLHPHSSSSPPFSFGTLNDSGLENPWVYQNTFVDMSLFGPVLDQVMSLANVSRL